MGEILEICLSGDSHIAALSYFGGKIHGHSCEGSEIELPDDWTVKDSCVFDKYNRIRASIEFGIFHLERRFNLHVGIFDTLIYEKYFINGNLNVLGLDLDPDKYFELFSLYDDSSVYRRLIAYWG